MTHTRIAIDGPAAAGKSTIAKRVAAKLGYLYIDTGAMYRAVTLYTLENGEEIIEEIEDHIHITFGVNNEVYLNDQDVSVAIGSNDVTKNVSYIASVEKVRTYTVDMQIKINEDSNVDIDRIDVGTTFLP